MCGELISEYPLPPRHHRPNCQVHDFKEGQHFLLERLSREEADLGGVVTDLLVEQHLAGGSLEEVVRVCKRQSHAEARPNPPLWAKVLQYLALRCQVSARERGACRWF